MLKFITDHKYAIGAGITLGVLFGVLERASNNRMASEISQKRMDLRAKSDKKE